MTDTNHLGRLKLAYPINRFYEGNRVIGDDPELTRARLKLVAAAKIVLKNTLDLIGVSAPESMYRDST